MKAILISIHPRWVELILNLIKKDEIRKGTAIGKAINKLIEEQGVAPMLIYCTKGKDLLLQMDIVDEDNINAKLEKNCDSEDPENSCDILNGKVVARFNATADLLELKMIEGGLYFTTPDRDCLTPNLDLNENAQIDNWQLLHYTGEKLGTKISDIHINDLEIFDKPKELSEFRHSHCDNFIKNVKVVLNAFDDYVFQYFDNERCCKCKHYNSDSNDCLKSFKPLTKAPQNYYYVELEK